MCVCCAPGSIWIRPSKLARLSPVAAPRQCTSPPDGPGLVQVDREHVEVLVRLGEEQAAEGHVAAGLADGELEVLAHEMAAEQRRQPVAVGVAADADEARRGVVHLARAPILHLREAAARAVLRGTARTRRRAAPGPRSPRRGRTRAAELAARGRRSTSVRAYCATPGAVDRVDDLERVLDDDARRARAGTRRRSRRPRWRPPACGGRSSGAWSTSARTARVCSRRPAPASTGSRRARPARGRARRGRPSRRSARCRPACGRSGSVRVTTSGTLPRRRRACSRGVAARRDRGRAGSSSRSPSAARPAARCAS